MLGRCPYCRSTRASRDDDRLVCEGCGAEFPMTEETPMTDNLFVYGLLMRDADRVATLQNYQLDFGYHATVVEVPAGIVYGGLVRNVTPERLAVYDQIEGVSGGYYTRRLVTVATKDDGPVRAWTYVMNPDCLALAKRNATETRDMWLVGSLAQQMHDEYERLNAPIYAHDELDYRVERWRERIAEEAADVC